jgi:hypothetical protein
MGDQGVRISGYQGSRGLGAIIECRLRNAEFEKRIERRSDTERGR